MKLLAIIGETVREARARKTLIGVFIFSSIMIVIAVLIFQMDVVKSNAGRHTGDVFHGRPRNSENKSEQLTPEQTQRIQAALLVSVEDTIGSGVAQLLYFFTVCVGIFATAGLITSIMEKGTIDLMLSKPVPRWLYIVGRYLGAVLIIFCEVAYFIGGLWVAAGISFSGWSPNLLLCIPYVTLGFAGIYAVVVLIGVLWRSSWLAIILGITIYFITGVIIPALEYLDKTLNGGNETGPFTIVAQILHWSLPQVSDISHNMGQMMFHQPVEVVPIFATLGLIAVYLGLSSFVFSKKEF